MTRPRAFRGRSSQEPCAEKGVVGLLPSEGAGSSRGFEYSFPASPQCALRKSRTHGSMMAGSAHHRPTSPSPDQFSHGLGRGLAPPWGRNSRGAVLGRYPRRRPEVHRNHESKYANNIWFCGNRSCPTRRLQGPHQEMGRMLSDSVSKRKRSERTYFRV